MPRAGPGSRRAAERPGCRRARIGSGHAHRSPCRPAESTIDNARAVAVGADVVQFFLGDPQGWKKPVLPEGVEALAGSGVDVFIHAPYTINVATSNNRIRIPSRKNLTQQLEAAASIGAKALIVHGGHVLKDDDPETGFENWRKVFERVECPIPVYIENTAGGGNAMARKFDRIARLWEALSGVPSLDDKLGFCLDTCHAHAAGRNSSTPSTGSRP